MGKYYALAAKNVEIAGAPDVVKILPLGFVHSQKGDFVVDKESFELMRQQMKDRRLDIPIDYEHQTLEDVQAPAGGWIKDIMLQEDAIAAKVEWTQKAAEYLKNKEYRYLSPVILARKKDNRAIVLHSVALTNTPAIDGMFPIINSIDINNYEDEGGNKMDLKALAKLLGLQEDATEEQVNAKLAEVIGENEKLKADKEKADAEKSDKEKTDKPADGEEKTEVVANKTILRLLGLKDSAKTEDVAASILALKSDSGNVAVEFKALKEKLAKKEADDVVLQALKAGKISAAQKEWAVEYALKSPDGFKSFVEKAPQVVPMGEYKEPEAVQRTSESTMIACKQLGVSEEDIKKYGLED